MCTGREMEVRMRKSRGRAGEGEGKVEVRANPKPLSLHSNGVGPCDMNTFMKHYHLPEIFPFPILELPIYLCLQWVDRPEPDAGYFQHCHPNVSVGHNILLMKYVFCHQSKHITEFSSFRPWLPKPLREKIQNTP